MKQTISLSAIFLLIFAAGCTERNFTKAKNGLEYKIIEGDGDTEIKYGNTVKFRAFTYYNDSLMATPYDAVPQLLEIDSTQLPPEYVNIFKSAKKGDSIVTRILVDSLMKISQVPPFAKKGQYLGYRFKILDVLTDPKQIAALKQETMETLRNVDSVNRVKQTDVDDKVLSDYIAKNNINATKTDKGTYVEVDEKGSGAPVELGKAVTIDYKGMTLGGTVFDQSYDSAGQSVKPFTFVVGQRGSIEGMADGIIKFNEGGKGRLFIPSPLAYGARGAGPEIPANTPLIFDVTVREVSSGEDYQKKMLDQQRMMQQLQQLQQQNQQPGQGK